jgi:streptogrisin C
MMAWSITRCGFSIFCNMGRISSLCRIRGLYMKTVSEFSVWLHGGFFGMTKRCLSDIFLLFVLSACITILVCDYAAAQEPDDAPPSESLLEDAATYAERYGVSLDEAVRRLRVQSKVGELEAALSREEHASFSGLWLEHEPTFRVVLSFTDSAAPLRLLPALPELGSMQGEVEVREARWTLADLEKDQAAAIALSKQLGFVVDADINVRENRVELYVVEDREIISGLRSAERALPASVVVIGVDRLAQPQQLDGGETFIDCTAGFTVRTTSGDMGISTAAHCNDTQSAQGRPLNFRSQDQQGNQDVQWHSACGVLNVSDNFESGIGLRDVSGTRHRDNQPIGATVFKFGKVTQRTFGTIESKSFAPAYVTNAASTFVRVDGGGRSDNLSARGDSGGPWYVGNTAYGIHSGSVADDDGGRDALYMPINYISSILVSVLTSDPPGPACNICSVTLCGSGRPPCCTGACAPSGLGGIFTCQE